MLGDFLHHLVCSLFRSLSTGRLTDLLLKAAFGAQISEAGSNDSLNNEKPMEIAGRWKGQADLGGCPGLRWVAEEFGWVPPTKGRILF